MVRLRVGYTCKRSLCLRRGFLIKFLKNFLRLEMIGCVTLSLTREEVLVHKARRKLVESVVKRIMVFALLGRTISLGVTRVDTRFNISLMKRARHRKRASSS